MDGRKLKETVVDFFQKYKFVILVLLLGLVLMLIPSRSVEKTEPPAATAATEAAELPLSQQLSQLLSQMEGAGKVQVILTLAAGEETFYQSDDEIVTNSDSNTTRRDTVIVSDSQRGQNGLIRQINPPQYKGAVIICQGADTPTVRLAIVEAVSKATGIGADHITVLKMK